IEELQANLLKTGVVGKSNSLADIVKTVHRELFLGKEEQFKIPESANAVAQTLITYQNSHRPQDLWHFVTPDYRKTSIWVQLKSGDNMDMAGVVKTIDNYITKNPPPFPLKHQWFGLTYINVIWQDKMVSGMLQAFLGSFLVVLLMMTILFRSVLWGLLSMVPLTVTIGLIYGAIGLIGKDYDMPVAVLSSLSLGLAIDYAIHFLVRSRMLQEQHKSWLKTIGPVFGEPARAISRNVVVVGAGFLPLLAAPLVPYKTVGVFIAAILLTAGAASLLILPSLITLLERWLFPKNVIKEKL
ncbi:MAG: MMPL family transporter, partial [Nitrospinota bacterium]